MTAGLIASLTLWGHALAALLFAGAAGAAWRRPERGRLFTAALVASALWALAVAGIDARDPAAQLAKTARDLLWLAFAVTQVRRAGMRAWPVTAAASAIAGVLLIAGVLALAEAAAHGTPGEAPLAGARLLFRMLAAIGALVLVRQAYIVAAPGTERLTAAALGAMWGADLVLAAIAYARPGWAPAVAAARGGIVAGAALLLVAAAQRRSGRTPALSRPAALQTFVALALALYLAGVAALARLAGSLGGIHGQALEAAVVIGATTALLTIVTTTRAGPWLRVTLAKHLFQHRYDYRTEWLRFAETLRAAPDGAPLAERAARAVAQPFDAPAALLLDADAATGWRWTGDAVPLLPTLAAHLADTARIIELDAVRAGTAPADADAVPAWMLAHPDAWVLAPLLHDAAFVGAVLIARPPQPRPLDWEDLDLLRTLGRQVASHLAEDRAGRALAEAQRFDEFNRRFAFILHDIKNLVSQQQLVARNAERHAENPAFRADMVATLRDSADRMTQLLARLAEREPPAAEPLAAVDVAALAARLAARIGATVTATPTWALAHPQRLEQALAHLLQNAGEASPDHVALTVRATGERVAIEVADRGAGMSAAFVRDELFRPFSSTKPAGFGVGAFEARQLVLGMAGTLTVDSREGEGTRFAIELPAAPALAAAA